MAKRKPNIERFITKPPKRLSDSAKIDRLRSCTHRQTRKWLERHVADQKNRCFYCRSSLKDDATLDHVIPLSREGLHDECNTVAACERCNKLKDNMLVDEFLPILDATIAAEKAEMRAYWIAKNQAMKDASPKA